MKIVSTIGACICLVFLGCHGSITGEVPGTGGNGATGDDLSDNARHSHDGGSGNVDLGSSGGGGIPDLATDGGGSTPIDLCAGLVSDKLPRAMTALAKPPLGQTVVDPQFGTTIRRITAASGTNAAIVPMYTTMPAWNADESRLILFDVASGSHQLYDGKSYAFIRALDIKPADVEQVYWSTSDPDVLFYVDGKSFIRYHVAAATKETRTTFSFCTGGASNGSDPMFTSFDSRLIGLKCDDQVFLYDIEANAVIARQTLTENPAQVAPSGKLAYLSDSGRVTDASLSVERTLDLKEPYGHASLGRLPSGDDTWNGQVFDPGPNGDDDIGSVVTFNLASGASKVVIGPKTGFPYPPNGHVSAMALRQPGWVVNSNFGNTAGAGLLDLETLLADTSTGAFCRVGRHRSWGKANTQLATPYWAEAHATPSPSGTRIVFASDWGNGATVDSYVIELPSYQP
jgi:hypothetical protein